MEKPVVLVADDNDATCTLLTALLQRDFRVDIARDGHEVVEKLKNRQYAAILLDLLMPILDGYAVLDHLRDERPDLLRRVLVVTAALTTRELQRVRAYEVFAIVGKPFEVDMLQALVRDCAVGEDEQPSTRAPIIAGGMLLLLADVLRRL